MNDSGGRTALHDRRATARSPGSFYQMPDTRGSHPPAWLDRTGRKPPRVTQRAGLSMLVLVSRTLVLAAAKMSQAQTPVVAS